MQSLTFGQASTTAQKPRQQRRRDKRVTRLMVGAAKNRGTNDATRISVNLNLTKATVPSLLYWRSTFTLPLRPILSLPNFHDVVSIYKSRRSTTLLLDGPKIMSPHVGPITALDIDNNNEGRFLLAASGGTDCTISVYDLSFLGSDYHVHHHHQRQHHEQQQQHYHHHIPTEEQIKKRQLLLNTHRPVARSTRAPPPPSRQRRHYTVSNLLPHHHHDDDDTDPTYIPSGHRHSIINAQWYPIDTGAFISASVDGTVLIWDTNTFTPVFAFDYLRQSSMGQLRCVELPRDCDGRTQHMLLAIGGTPSLVNDDFVRGGGGGGGIIKLCDIKSGATSHELVGHGRGGVNAVKWHPTSEFILCSGGDDATIRLWDVRKSGSRACLCVLDQDAKKLHHNAGGKEEEKEEMGVNNNEVNVAHHRAKRRRQLSSRRTLSPLVGPGNYSQVQSSRVTSHGGPVSGLCCTPDGRYLVSTGCDERVKLWDLSPCINPASGSLSDIVDGCLSPAHFLGRDATSRPVSTTSRSVAVAITQPGTSRTTTVWVGGDGDLLGYELHGMGGTPYKLLSGHLDDVTSVVSQDHTMRIFTGGKDGMILSWGCKDVVGTVDEAVAFFAKSRQRRRGRENPHYGGNVSAWRQKERSVQEDFDRW